jgi:hypothetical protein
MNISIEDLKIVAIILKVYILTRIISWESKKLFDFCWLENYFTLMQITVAFMVVNT